MYVAATIASSRATKAVQCKGDANPPLLPKPHKNLLALPGLSPASIATSAAEHTMGQKIDFYSKDYLFQTLYRGRVFNQQVNF